jgi:uncharacterized protein YdeI (YjbR/CyaY-like superfamily)
LSRVRAAGARFGLAASCRREYADWIRQAKKQETRDKRALSTIQMLRGGRKRVTM